MKPSVTSRDLTRTAAIVCFHLLLGTAARAESKIPPIGDLVGRWECASGSCSDVIIKIEPASEISTDLVVHTTPKSSPASPGKQWNVDSDFDPRKGLLWLNRAPSAEEIDENQAPLWARKAVEGELLWRLQLRSARGETSFGGLSGDKCALTLKGSLFPGKLEFDVDKHQASVIYGAEALIDKFDVEFKKIWYDPSPLDGKIIFSWREDTETEIKLAGYGQYVLNELNSSTLERQTLDLYRELSAYVFKSMTYAFAIYGAGATLVGEAEKQTYIAASKKLAEDYAQNTLENIIGKAIKGDAIGREIFIEALAATTASFVVGRLLDPVSPSAAQHDAIMMKLAEEVGEGAAEPIAEAVRSGGKSDKIETEARNQCRFVLRQVKLPRDIAGVLIADRATHEAGLVLYVPAGDQSPSAVVAGRYFYVDDNGQRPAGQQHIYLTVLK